MEDDPERKDRFQHELFSTVKVLIGWAAICVVAWVVFH
jgi:hypothetical protein